MKVLILDGNWNLKRNYERHTELVSSRGDACSGSFGFLDSLRSVLNHNLSIDRVCTFWDGLASGVLRYDLYPAYKNNRNKSFEIESYLMTPEQIDDAERKKFSILQQKIKVKNYLEELFIRQLEVDTVEADDLIAQYCLTKQEDEEIIIFSRDKDYLQLVDDKISVLRPSSKTGEGNELITKANFKSKFGYIIENALTLRCFEGDTSDCIQGIDGVALTTILKYFPRFNDEIYTIDRFIEEAVELYTNSKKKPKALEKIIGSRKVFERNYKLMNLKEPFLTEQAIVEIEEIRECVIATPERSIYNAQKMLSSDGMISLIWQNNVDLFFRPFYALSVKEKEYAKKMLNENN